MLFAIVNPTTQKIDMVECLTEQHAMALAGLVNVDHGVIIPPHRDAKRIGLAIMVYEFGLYDPPDKQSYFALAGMLYAGNAVLYGFNEGGETVDIIGHPRIVFLPSVRAVERNIELGLIKRPQVAVNDVVLWRWPEPVPPGMRRA